MIYDLMPLWLRKLLNMDSAVLPTEVWTWRHTCPDLSPLGLIALLMNPENLCETTA